MSHQTFPKPQKKEKPQRFGVYRINKKQEHIKHDIPKQKHIKREFEPVVKVWSGDSLLQPYSVGIKFDKVTDEIYAEVKKRSGGICEFPDCDCQASEVHHISHIRQVHAMNLFDCCTKHHKVPFGIHGNADRYYYVMDRYQKWCMSKGYSREDTQFLLGRKDNALVSDWETGERIVFDKG